MTLTVLNPKPHGTPAAELAAQATQVLREAERRAEWLLAWIRAAAFLLLVFGLRVFEYAEHSDFFFVSLVVYGAATVAAIALAWWRIYHRLAAWVLVTLDVALILVCTSMALQRAGEPTALFAHPAALMIFLVLAYGAARYRPAILISSGAVFVAGWAAISVDNSRLFSFGAEVQRGTAIALTILVLTTLTLWIASRRARLLLLRVFEEARLRELLARYVADPVIRNLDKRVVRRQDVAILFADIRGFTAISERLDPSELVGFLVSYREICERVIRHHGGVVDKFIGDAVMAVFEGPDRAASAARCVASAIALLRDIEQWNAARKKHGEPSVEVGIGAHLGDAIAGTIGREGRLEHTVIGDAVNTAQRIERLTSKLDKSLLISVELLAAAGHKFHGMFRSLGSHQVEGRRQPVAVLEFAHHDPR